MLTELTRWRSGVATGLTAGMACLASLVGIMPTSWAVDDAPWIAWVSGNDPGLRLAIVAPTSAPATTTIDVITADRGQTWQGVGGALTDAAAGLIASHPGIASLLYDPARTDGAHLNLVRLPLSSTDFSTTPWTFGWNDTTRSLTAPSTAIADVSTLTRQLLPQRLDLSVIASPWSAPAAMKDSGSLNGGSLLASSIPAYTRMLSAEAGWLRDQHVPLTAMTEGNEPFNSAAGVGGYPSMLISDQQQVELAQRLSPGLQASGVGLWAVDHNWSNRPDYDNVETSGLFQGSAFHCYGGTPDQMDGVAAAPIVTECTGTTDGFPGTFRWDAYNLVVGAIANGSTGLLMWNLALDQNDGPHTHGCSTCRGVVEVDTTSGAVTENPEFYTLAQLARATDPGATVVRSTAGTGILSVAFVEPNGDVGVFGYNDTGAEQVVQTSVDGIAAPDRFAIGPGEMFTLRGPPPGSTASPVTTTWSESRPATLPFGSAYTLTGRITGEGQPVAGAAVQVWAFPAGSSGYVDLANLTTNSDGRVTYSYRPRLNSRVQLRFGGSNRFAPSTAPACIVRIRPTSSVALRPATTHLGATVLVYGTLAPAVANTRVTLQMLRGTRWTTLRASATVHKQRLPDGRITDGFVIEYRPTIRGRAYLRVITTANAYISSTHSSRVLHTTS